MRLTLMKILRKRVMINANVSWCNKPWLDSWLYAMLDQLPYQVHFDCFLHIYETILTLPTVLGLYGPHQMYILMRNILIGSLRKRMKKKIYVKDQVNCYIFTCNCTKLTTITLFSIYDCYSYCYYNYLILIWLTWNKIPYILV